MNTEQPHYGNAALAHNDQENWRAYCASERIDFWVGMIFLLPVLWLIFYFAL